MLETFCRRWLLILFRDAIFHYKLRSAKEAGKRDWTDCLMGELKGEGRIGKRRRLMWAGNEMEGRRKE